MVTQPNKRSHQLGGLLIALGLLFFLANLGLFDAVARTFWTGAFFVGGAAFLGLYTRQREQWWALIPGSTLLGLGAATLGGEAAGSLFLGLIGLGFAGIYWGERKHWWAVIPAGVLLTLALVAGVGARLESLSGLLFFLGLAATFGLLFVLPEGRGKQDWALYPALALLGLAIISSNLLGFVTPLTWPAVLILAGLFLLWRSGVRRV